MPATSMNMLFSLKKLKQQQVQPQQQPQPQTSTNHLNRSMLSRIQSLKSSSCNYCSGTR